MAGGRSEAAVAESSSPQLVTHLIEVIEQQVEQQRSWSGLLPPPADFGAYRSDVQDRMLRWTDAWTSDESDRRGRRLEHEIDMDRRGSSWAIAIIMALSSGAFVLFLLDKTIGGAALVAPSILLFLGRMFPSRRGGSPSENEPGS